MKQTFYNLSDEKQINLVNAAIEEFSKNNYMEGSINSIIKNAKISKGGLFKYISNKEDLYLYVMEKSLEELTKFQMSHIKAGTDCYFDRIYELTTLAFVFYKDHMETYQMILRGVIDYGSPCFNALNQMRIKLAKDNQQQLLGDINWGQYNRSITDIQFLLECSLNGYNARVVSELDSEGCIEEFMKKMENELKMILDVIKKGVID